MARGRQPEVNREINWVSDEDGNVIGYMKDPKTLIQITELTDEQRAKTSIVAAAGTDSSGNIYDAAGNIIGPVSITGIFQYNQTVTANLAAGWSATGYQWTRDGNNISGATSNTYTLVGADIGKAVTIKVSGLTYTGQDGETVIYTGPKLLRFATAFNKLASGSVGVASGEERRVAARMHRPIGSSAKKSLQVVANNFYLSGIDALTIPPTELTVVGCYIECNSVSVPISWSGNFTPTFAAGDADIPSDEVFPSQFGLANFNRDRAMYLRIEVSVPVGGNIPVSEGVESLSNCRSYYVSAGSVNNLSGTGTMTFTGTTSATFELPFLIIGEDVDTAADAGSFIGLGDSLFAQGGPSSYFHQACAGSGSNYIAGCSISKVGAVANLWTANAATLGKFIKYANRVNEEFGTNMVGSSLSSIQTALQTVWSGLKANKSTHPQARDLVILRSPLMNRTTDATGATVHSAAWNAGGIVEQLNDWLATQEAQVNGFNVFVANLIDSPNLMRRGAGTKGVAGSDFYKWLATVTGEGLHLNNTGASGVNGVGANARVYYVANA